MATLPPRARRLDEARADCYDTAAIPAAADGSPPSPPVFIRANPGTLAEAGTVRFLSVLLLGPPQRLWRITRRQERLALGVACAFLLAVLVTFLPLFLRMPVWFDVILFDIFAKTILRHGSLYQHLFYNAFPGMVWMQTGVRYCLGWSDEAIRFADFLVVAANVLLLSRLIGPRAGLVRRTALCGLLFCFYFSTSEWCHCQRDTWMLLPTLAAVWLREKEVKRLIRGGGLRLWPSLLEGICWAVAFVIKPFVLIVAAPIVIATVAIVWAYRPRAWRALLLDLSLVTLGAAVIVGTSCWALRSSGDWPFFYDGLTEWSVGYYEQAPKLLDRIAKLFEWLPPWGWVHALALLAAVAVVGAALFHKRLPAENWAEQGTLETLLLALLYLAWSAQANFLQWQFDYHLVPPVLLAVALIFSMEPLMRSPVVLFLALPALVATALIFHPLLATERLALWSGCCTEPSTPARKNALTLTDQPMSPDWVQLEEVRAFLAGLHLKQRELTCHSVSTISLYLNLDLEPSTRYVPTWVHLFVWPMHAAEIEDALRRSPQEYVVVDCDDPMWGDVAEAERSLKLWGPAACVAKTERRVSLNRDYLIFITPRYVVLRTRGGWRVEGGGCRVVESGGSRLPSPATRHPPRATRHDCTMATRPPAASTSEVSCPPSTLHPPPSALHADGCSSASCSSPPGCSPEPPRMASSTSTILSTSSRTRMSLVACTWPTSAGRSLPKKAATGTR